jgi:hypothetical protein
MATSHQLSSSSREISPPWLQRHINPAAITVTLLGFLARLWTASGTFLNPDEALHFRLANQASLLLAYKRSLLEAHPPLLTFVLYFWRPLGASELWLRLPLILASVAFCWIFYKWLSNAAGNLAGFIGLIFVALLPPIVLLSSEIREYPLLLLFLASSLYLLDDAFAKNSSVRMAAFSLCLCLAMLSQYATFLFAAALGIYALLRSIAKRESSALLIVWATGQLGALALALFLYKTHISKLNMAQSGTPVQGLMSETYLHRSYIDPAHDNPLLFLAGHTFGVFQYYFGQLAVGDLMGLVFLIGVALLLRGTGFPQDRSSRRLGVLLLLPFAIACAASLAHLYPYGGIRHVAFLIIPAVAGVSIAIAQLTAEKYSRGIPIAAAILLVCIAFSKPRPPRMDRTDQSPVHIAAALEFIQHNINPSDAIFTDFQSDLILGHYLCRQQPIFLEPAPANFEQFSCAGHRIFSTQENDWIFWANNFPQLWQRFEQSYNPTPGTTVWIIQAGWGVSLPEGLRRTFPEFRKLHSDSFGNNIKIFKLTAGQPMPAAVSQFDQTLKQRIEN